MKAVYITQQGPPSVLTLGERPDPKVGPGEVKVRVRAAALNHLDVFTRAGDKGTKAEFKEPRILGCDIAGEVAEVGPSVSGFKAGERVVFDPGITCGSCEFCTQGRTNLCPRYTMIGTAADGGYAELAKAPQENVHRIPEWMGYPEAAAIPLVFITAWHMLKVRANLQPGEVCLVQAAGSGVGSAAIQIAKVLGARVITTASADDKLKKAKEWGADEVINYKQEDFTKRVMELTNGRGADVVFDHIGSDIFEGNARCLAQEGRFVTCGVSSGHMVQLHLGRTFTRNLSYIGSRMGTKRDMHEFMRLVHQKRLRGVVAAVFPLKDAAKAHELMESRNFYGKIVLEVA